MQPESNKIGERTAMLLKSIGGPFAALAILLAVCCISNEHFRSIQNLMNANYDIKR